MTNYGGEFHDNRVHSDLRDRNDDQSHDHSHDHSHHVHNRDHGHRNHDPYLLCDVHRGHIRDLDGEDIQLHDDTQEEDVHQRKDEHNHLVHGMGYQMHSFIIRAGLLR